MMVVAATTGPAPAMAMSDHQWLQQRQTAVLHFLLPSSPLQAGWRLQSDATGILLIMAVRERFWVQYCNNAMRLLHVIATRA
jgi:hypothetical protein